MKHYKAGFKTIPSESRPAGSRELKQLLKTTGKPRLASRPAGSRELKPVCLNRMAATHTSRPAGSRELKLSEQADDLAAQVATRRVA